MQTPINDATVVIGKGKGVKLGKGSITIEEYKLTQSPLEFRGIFTPRKFGARFMYQSTNGVILERKYTYDESEAKAFCKKANEVMIKMEEIRRVGSKLLIALRFSSGENAEKIKNKLEEKEKEMVELFNTIL